MFTSHFPTHMRLDIMFFFYSMNEPTKLNKNLITTKKKQERDQPTGEERRVARFFFCVVWCDVDVVCSTHMIIIYIRLVNFRLFFLYFVILCRWTHVQGETWNRLMSPLLENMGKKTDTHNIELRTFSVISLSLCFGSPLDYTCCSIVVLLILDSFFSFVRSTMPTFGRLQSISL